MVFLSFFSPQKWQHHVQDPDLHVGSVISVSSVTFVLVRSACDRMLLTPSQIINLEPPLSLALACPIHAVPVCPQPPTPPQFSVSSACFRPFSCSWSFRGSTGLQERFLGLTAPLSLSDPTSYFLCSSYRCPLPGTVISFSRQALPSSRLPISSCRSYLVQETP